MDTFEKIKAWEQTECFRVMEEIGIREGDAVIDFGCGFGHYTFPAAELVKQKGKVYAIDKNKDILNYINKLCDSRSISNITAICADEAKFCEFEDGSINCVFLYDILHGQNMDRYGLIREIHRCLCNNGILSILPFHFSNYRDKSGKKKTYKPNQLIREIEELGFELINIIENGGVHFEKYHSPHYIDKGGVTFEELERGTIYNMRRVSR